MSWEKDDAWSKKPGPRRARGRARSGKTDRHQPDQSSADAQGSSVWEDSRRKAEKRKKHWYTYIKTISEDARTYPRWTKSRKVPLAILIS